MSTPPPPTFRVGTSADPDRHRAGRFHPADPIPHKANAAVA